MKKYSVLLLTVLFLLSACTPELTKKPAVVKKTPPVKPVIIKSSDTEIDTDTAVIPQNVFILLSSNASSYQQIANHLTRELGGRAIRLELSKQTSHNTAIIKQIKAAETRQIVTIGLKAAKAVKAIKNKQVIFTQVVNYQEHNLLSENMKGVSALPSPEKLFKDWRALSPELKKVAVVVGKNLQAYLQDAKKAAKSQGIELIIEEVASDKEFIYRSKSLPPGIEGQWILPDNRVLSGKALKEVMAYGSRRGRQIVVFGPRLLSFGALFYVSADEKAIADGVLKRLAESTGKNKIPGENVLPVKNHEMGINEKIARQINLTIPAAYRKYINAE